MDISTIYAARSLPRPSLGAEVLDLISKLKISFKPMIRRIAPRRRAAEENWRESALVDAVRKVREKDDSDYDEINAAINKLSKTNYSKIMLSMLETLGKRDEMFRLRVTTLLFDRGIRQNFYATLMADAYNDIAKRFPEALQDLTSQVELFDKLYDTANITTVPSSDAPGYEEAILQWSKQKEMKRGFAVYVGELYARGLLPEETMAGFLNTVFAELRESIRAPKTGANEEHVDALVRFLYAVAGKVAIVTPLRELLSLPKPSAPSLTMKSRFKLEDAVKLSRV